MSRHIASGVMLAGLLVAFGFAWVQPDDGARSVDVDVVAAPETADVAGAETDDSAGDAVASDEAETAERPVTPADRVVDEAGFPSIAEAEPIAQQDSAGPVVTINGRPIRERESTQTASSSEETDEAAPSQAPTQEVAAARPDSSASGSPDGAETQVAVQAPPLPLPRPEGLEGPRTAARAEPNPGAIDYDAIAAAAYGEDDTAFMTPEERRALAPMPGVANFDPEESFDPRSEGLVEVIDASGERIWVYEDQMRETDSRVTFDNRRTRDEFGFVYEDEGPVW